MNDKMNKWINKWVNELIKNEKCKNKWKNTRLKHLSDLFVRESRAGSYCLYAGDDYVTGQAGNLSLKINRIVALILDSGDYIENADINMDGVLDVIDIVQLVSLILNG